MIVIIDNYDSFTYNIVEYYKQHRHQIKVFRNDQITIQEIEALQPSLLVLSPGPKDPQHAGITVESIQHFKGKIPIFGVCLGCQSIAVAFGGKITRAEKMYHGKTSQITHEGQGVLSGVHSPMFQMRYHSLLVDEHSLPTDLEITARSHTGEIMALRHKKYPIEAVQFHPESIASIQGEIILANSLHMISHKTERTHAKRPESSQEINDDLFEYQQEIINNLLQKNNLSKKEASQLMQWFSENSMSPTRIAMTLTALRMKGETATEIAGIAEQAWLKAIFFPLEDTIKHLVDIVGTGGDFRNTFNISTTAAIVAAGAGAKVAKHGNRAVSSKSGSADVLEALGMAIDIAPHDMAQVLQKSGMCFLYAPMYHPSMKYVAPVRKELKIRTLFNILGPLVNPAKVPNIVLGVFSKTLMPLMADTLQEMGIERAMVVHSDQGVDEITLDGITDVIEITQTHQRQYSIDPVEYIPEISNIPQSQIITHLEGGTAQENAQLIKDLLSNNITDPVKHIVVSSVVALNAGAGIYISGVTNSLSEGIELAQKAISSGSAKRVLDNLTL